MNLKELLKEFKLEAEVTESIIDKINAELPKSFVPKDQYNKKAKEVTDLSNKVHDFEAERSNDTTASELKRITKEYEDYKKSIETEQVHSVKRGKLEEALKGEGANDKLLKLLITQFDLDKLEIVDDKIKDWNEVAKPVKEAYSDLFSKTEERGTPPMNPPTSGVSDVNIDVFMEGFNSV